MPDWGRPDAAGATPGPVRRLPHLRGRVVSGREMELHYDHPILLLQHMVWHEGYHHGQIKLALKVAGRPIPDAQAGRVTWGVWMRKT